MTEAQNPLSTRPLASRLAAMLALNHAVYTDRDLQVLIRQLLGMVSEVVECEAASLALIDPETDELVFQFAVGEASQDVERFRLPVGKGVAGWVAKHGKSARLDDVRTDERFTGVIDQASGFQTQSLLCVPIWRGGRSLGVLEAINKRHGVFTSDDETLCALLANTVAVSLENFQLHRLYRQRLGDPPSAGVLAPDEESMMTLQRLLASEGPMVGFLATHPLSTVVRVLVDSHVTGHVHLERDTESVELTLEHGEVVDAWMASRKLVGAVAFLEALTWRSGLFRFESQGQVGGRTITEPLWILLAKGRARSEALRQWETRLPKAMPLAPQGASPADPVAAQLWPLLPASVGEVVAAAPLDRLTIYETLASLLSAGSLG